MSKGDAQMRWECKSLKLRTTGLFGGKLDEAEMDRLLNEHGPGGWEVATAYDANSGHGESRFVVIVMKRPKA